MKGVEVLFGPEVGEVIGFRGKGLPNPRRIDYKAKAKARLHRKRTKNKKRRR